MLPSRSRILADATSTLIKTFLWCSFSIYIILSLDTMEKKVTSNGQKLTSNELKITSKK